LNHPTLKEPPMRAAATVNTPDYWDQVYRHEWESGSVTSGNYHRDYGPIHDAVVRLIPTGSRVLDIACGAGLLCRKIKQNVPDARVVGVDFAAYIIRQNQERDRSLQIEYRCVDIRHALPSVGGEFDVVTMCEILEHLEEPEAVVAEALGLVRTGGRFILTCPHDNAIPDPEHVRCWGHDELFHLLASYSDTISFMHFPPPYFHSWMLAYLSKKESASDLPLEISG
jgi:2-polyprenyl-3-methyl-5-hydroxy-6-metoxy-1,4-benzoquinol methylase